MHLRMIATETILQIKSRFKEVFGSFFLFSTDIVVNQKKQKINKYVTVLLFILYSKWFHVENPKYKIICLKSQTSSEFAKKTVVKHPTLCLFHHVLTTIQFDF